MSKLLIRAVELSEANALVDRLHRHHKPAVGHRFSLGAFVSEELVGAAIVGRPVSRGVNQRTVLEVTRLVTDGTKNACSKLYAAAARAGKALGYERIQTYILETESGVSLIAAGWRLDGEVSGRQWDHAELPWLFDGPNRRTDQPTCGKRRWVKDLNRASPASSEVTS